MRTDIHYWLAATCLDGIGPHTLRRMLNHFDTLKDLFDANETEWRHAGFTDKQIQAFQQVNWKQMDHDLNWCEKSHCHILTSDDERYPLLLREITDPPLVLFVRGQTDVLSSPQLAMVGSRNPTVTGKELAGEFAYTLSKAGLVITSGLAEGIDGASHRGALRANAPTIAVCGTGLAHVYPASHRKLADEIIEKGALVSEFPPSAPPRAKHFPIRNRTISGLSMGVIVVEAALQSGSLITARYANEQGREVFAVPGSIHNTVARGCHYLIQQGAKLVENAGDILGELGALHAVIVESPSVKRAPLDKEKKDFLEKIGYEITALDAIILQSGLTAGEVSSMLLSLELDGYITVTTGGYLRN